MMRFQFTGVTTKCVPDWVTLELQACETDCPTGMSNSNFQSLRGAALMFVTVKLAMKPVCHVEVTDNVAVAAAAARAVGATIIPGTARKNAMTMT